MSGPDFSPGPPWQRLSKSVFSPKKINAEVRGQRQRTPMFHDTHTDSSFTKLLIAEKRFSNFSVHVTPHYFTFRHSTFQHKMQYTQ